MNVTGVLSLDAPPWAVRRALEDPERLARALPHVRGFAPAADGEGYDFCATIRPASALGELPFATRWRRAPSGDDTVAYEVEGRGGEHWLGLSATLVVTEADARSAVAYGVACRFGGTLLSVGQRVLRPVVDHQVRLVLEQVGREAAALRAAESR